MTNDENTPPIYGNDENTAADIGTSRSRAGQWLSMLAATATWLPNHESPIASTNCVANDKVRALTTMPPPLNTMLMCLQPQLS